MSDIVRVMPRHILHVGDKLNCIDYVQGASCVQAEVCQ